MARDICKICGWDARNHPNKSRTAHLIEVHGMLVFETMVRRNFIRPNEVTKQDRESWDLWKVAQRMLLMEVE